MTANKQRLAPAKDWRNRPIETWNTLTFTEYLKDAHIERFGIPYAPMRSWRMEQGQIGSLIGTREKPRQITNEMLKEFIDECFASYTPTAQYPGTNFGFSFAYRKNVLQRLQAEELAQERRRTSVEEAPDLDTLDEWW